MSPYLSLYIIRSTSINIACDRAGTAQLQNIALVEGNGPCEFVCDSPNEAFTITCGGGSWQGEVGWTIQTVDGFEVLSGGAPFDSNDYSEAGRCLEAGCYQVVMTDTYGDGWNGNELEIGEDLEFTIEGFSSEGSAILMLVKVDVVTT